MKTLYRVLPVPTSVSALILGLCFAFLAPAQVTSPNGSYGILVNQWKDSNSNAASSFLGVLTFNGAGNVSGSYTLVRKDYSVLTGTLTGTYSGNPDASNTVSLTFDVGATLIASVAVTDGGAGLQIMVTGGTATKVGQVITGTGRVQSGGMPTGSFGMLLNRLPDQKNDPQGVFGIFSLDGAGNITGSASIIGPNLPAPSITTNCMGTYSVKPDGTGNVTVNLDLGFSSTFAIVVVDGGAGILMLQTDESDGLGEILSGTARMQ